MDGQVVAHAGDKNSLICLCKPESNGLFKQQKIYFGVLDFVRLLLRLRRSKLKCLPMCV